MSDFLNEKVTVTRPDGSTASMTREELEATQGIGNSQQTPLAGHEQAVADSTEAYYTSGAQQVLTGVEGLASGASLGLTDAIEAGLGWDAGQRADYNPGIRLGTEIVGAIGSAVISPGSLIGKAAAYTPAGMLAKGAKAIGSVAAEGRVARAVVSGAVEGAGFGAGGALTHASLNGDPLTAESVIAGMGWGALWGGGLSGLVSKAGAVAEASAARRAATEVAGKTEVLIGEHYGAFRSAIDDARSISSKAVSIAEQAVASAKVPLTAEELTERVFNSVNAREAAQAQLVNKVTMEGKLAGNGVRAAKEDLVKTLRKATLAASNGETAKLETLMAEHAAKAEHLSKLTNVAAPEMEIFSLSKTKLAESALGELASLKEVDTALKSFPATAEGFAATTPSKLNKHADAIDKLMTSGGAEMQGVKDAVKATISQLAESTGLKLEGSAGDQLRGIYEAAKTAKKAGSAGSGKSKIASAIDHIVGSTAAGAMKNTGPVGRAVGYAAGSMVSGLLGLKGAVIGALQSSVQKWAPSVVRVAEKASVGARIDPLRTRLDGTVDEAKRTRKQLMQDRAEEVRRAAPAIRDTLYRSVSSIAAQHPDFAAATHEAAIKQFEQLSARVPRDPGTAMARMKSVWGPDAIATERFARYYEVFHNPVAVAKRALETGTITPEAAVALRENSPQLFMELRLGMMDRISQPEVMDKMSYQDQITLGRLLDITIHSTSAPRFIAAQQAMYQQRNDPQAVKPGMSSSNNPSGGRPGGTSAQRITDH